MQDFMLVEMKDASSFFTQSFMVMGICFSACIFPCGQAYMRFAAVGAGSNQLRRGMARDGPVQLAMDRGVNSLKSSAMRRCVGHKVSSWKPPHAHHPRIQYRSRRQGHQEPNEEAGIRKFATGSWPSFLPPGGPGPNLSRRNIKQGIFPYLLHGMEAGRPDEVWAIDITYIRLRQGFVYLAAIIDLYSRYIIAWDISTTLEIGFILETVMHALALTKPEIFNSDQGSQFTSPQYVELLKSAGVRISMDGKNRALDNVFIERFWRSAKWECVYLSELESPRDVRQGIAKYIRFYNWERPHQSLGYQMPAEVYHATPIVAA